MPYKLDSKDISKTDIKENHNKYVERTSFYRSIGFDQEQARINIIKTINNKPENILELGTGKGYLTTILAETYPGVTTVDIKDTESRIALLNACYKGVQDKINFLVLKENELNYADQTFDVVISAFTFHHMKDPYKSLFKMLNIFKEQLIISDFHQKGFDLINKAHALEGRIHDQEKNNFNDVKLFCEREGFAVREQKDEWQTIFIIEKNIQEKVS
jgi:ubiquinone/menaquinone biosynthesis C-methylase UbiE